VWIDLVGRDAAEARDVLITGIQQTRAKPAEAPAYPRSAAPPFPNAD
jgi:hypothetical protein